MSEISVLEMQINSLRNQIRQLEDEKSGLKDFQNENLQAIDKVDFQLQRKEKVADKFWSLNKISTFAFRLSDRVTESYSGKNRIKVLNEYSNVGTNIKNAIHQVEYEIAEKKQEIVKLQARIEQIREEMRRAEEERRRAEEERRAEEKRRAEQQHRV